MKPQLTRYVFLLVPLLLVVLYWTSSRPPGDTGAFTQRAPDHATLAEARPRVQQGLPSMPMPDLRRSLSQQVDQLIATGRPADAYDAFWLVQTCINFQSTGHTGVPDGDFMRPPNDAEKFAKKLLCADLTERMKTARLEHLAVAVKAGVDSADLGFLQAGPFGDPSALTSRPDDPLVLAWKAEALGYLEAQAQQGRIHSMIALVGEYKEDAELAKQHPLSALRFATAVHGYYESLLYSAPASIANPLPDEFLQQLSQGLTPEQVKLATAQGKQLLERVMKPGH